MKEFTDQKQRKWQLAINVATVRRVRDLAKVDLMEVLNDKSEENLLVTLGWNPVLLCDVLYAVCKPQAEAAGISDEDFGEGLAGDCIEDAARAFLEELVDFFPPGRRGPLKAVLSKLRSAEQAVTDAAMSRLNSGRIEEIVSAEIGKADREFEARIAALNSAGN